MIGCRSTGTESSSLSGPSSHLAGSLVACQLQIKPLSIRPVKVIEGEAVQELSRPHRSNSKEQLSESSTHSLSGRGYSVSGIFMLHGFTTELQSPTTDFMALALDILIMLNRVMEKS
ncbi:unnamed protein product [Tetraodon nigroviridis]|uniref:(spotted green pufferfish) hypothetical protein n=1 Tax=Tetraodon nigroviridis TaxID=99883 RepID=Q4RPJ6_TETNG|nr:unnamed protein product [Tetraodon nigroviridis]